MADDRARKLAESALNRLVAELHAGKSEALKNYLATIGRFHHYSWGNVLLIASQKPTATRVAGMHKWNELGRQVKEAEKGIIILAPVFKKDRDLAPTQPNHGQTAAKNNAEYRLVGFRPAYVYDVEQTHGKPLPETAKTRDDPKALADKLSFAAKEGISLQQEKLSPGQNELRGERVEVTRGMTPGEDFSTLARELAAEMLHHGNGEANSPKTVVETQAETVAYVVCRGVGLVTNSAAADYIHLYNGDKKMLAESLSVIQETSSKILDNLFPDQQRSPFQDKPGRALTHTPALSQGEPSHTHPAVSTPAAQAADRSDSISLDR